MISLPFFCTGSWVPDGIKNMLGIKRKFLEVGSSSFLEISSEQMQELQLTTEQQTQLKAYLQFRAQFFAEFKQNLEVFNKDVVAPALAANEVTAKARRATIDAEERMRDQRFAAANAGASSLLALGSTVAPRPLKKAAVRTPVSFAQSTDYLD